MTLAVAAQAMSATGAPAATVSVSVERQPQLLGVAIYSAYPGEENRLEVAAVDSVIRLRDTGAVIQPGAGCTSVNDHEVLCGAQRARIFLGDRNDAADVPGPVGLGVAVRGGGGNDLISDGPGHTELAGDDGDDALHAGGGHDVLDGGGGSDTLVAGPGNDRMTDGDLTLGSGVDADVLDGGDGRDAVDYSRRQGPVVVDLSDPGPDGQAGEGDVLRAVENAFGGAAGDTLGGDSGRNFFIGNGGDDAMVGAGGKDRLYGGSGADLALGLSGRDSLSGGTGRDVLDGGDGDDELFGGRSPDVLFGGRGKDILGGDEGDDRLDGDSGRDRFFGGSGGDAIDSADAEREVVNCGPGRDRARLDRRDSPFRCERLRVRRR